MVVSIPSEAYMRYTPGGSPESVLPIRVVALVGRIIGARRLRRYSLIVQSGCFVSPGRVVEVVSTSRVVGIMTDLNDFWSGVVVTIVAIPPIGWH